MPAPADYTRRLLAAGPGLHRLTEDSIAFGGYFSFGVDALGHTSFSVQLGLHQAF